MITVLISSESKYPISLATIKKELAAFINGHGITVPTEVSVSIVSEKTALEVSNRTLKDNAVHDVLSFPENELRGDFVNPPDTPNQLGEIIVCYEMAVEEAKEEEMSIERKIIELVNHGALHLLGFHHE
jgi:probable rRNA maturation factor